MTISHVFTADAIVLKRRNVGEADRSLTLFTKHHGKISVLARGVRKISSKRAPHIEVFTRIIVTVHKGKRINSLTDVSPVESYNDIRTDLKRVSAAYYLCELVDGLLPEEQIHAEVFDLLATALTTLAHLSRARVDILRMRFAAALLTTLGYLEQGKEPPTGNIDAYVEQLLERKLKTVRLASQLAI